MELGRGLQPHIVREILCRVVISNLPNLRVLSKAWNHFILDNAHDFFFTNANDAFLLSTCDRTPNNKLLNPKMHCIRFDNTEHLGLDLESEWTKSPSLTFDGDWHFIYMNDNSCNGLVFLCKSAFRFRCDGIFNPLTNEFLQVPRGEFDGDNYYFGLGFFPTTKQYKLFRVTDSFFIDGNFDNNSSIMYVLSFSRRSETNHNHNQRTQLHSIPLFMCSHGAYLNGIIYWMGRTKLDKQDEYHVYALNVETEPIELSVVLDLGPCSTSKLSLKQFNGGIYASFVIKSTTNSSIQVWKMQEKDLWIREFVIDDLPNDWCFFTLVKAFEDGEILCMVNGDFFCWYNFFTGRKKIVTKNQRNVRNVCQIEYLNFGLLQNILAGESRDKETEETKGKDNDYD